MDKKFSMQDAMQMANTEAGKQLLKLLQSDNSDALKQAMSQAKQGDYNGLSMTLAPLMNKPEVQQLLKQLGGK